VPPERYRIADLVLDTGLLQVERDGEPIDLPQLSFDLLLELARAAPNVVTTDQLMDRVWRGVVVNPGTVAKRIELVREALGDDWHTPRYISLVRGRGYRLVAKVSPVYAPARARIRWLGYGIAGAAAAAYFVFRFLPGDLADAPQTVTGGVIPGEPPVHSIAVLPFANLSPAPDSDYLSDGLAAELLDQLTALPQLKVVARTSAFAFKDKDGDVTEIARQLRVTHILAGSFRQSGDRLRISAELVDASNGYHVWANTWNRTFTDIFDVQDEIATSVVGALRMELLNERLRTKRADPEAYKLYLRSKEVFAEQREPDIGKRGIDRLEEALSLIMQAIAIDPDYAPAWTHLAWMQFDLAQWKDGGYADAYARAISSAQRALAVDPTERGALVLLGAIDLTWTWDYESAARWYMKALIASPGHPRTLRAIAMMYRDLERPLPAHFPEVLDADPVDVQSKLNQVFFKLLDGRLDDASEQLEDVRKIAPDAIRFRIFEALLAYYEEDYEKAVRLAEDQGDIRSCALYKLQRYDEAQAELEKIQTIAKSHAYLVVAGIYACQGDNDNAFAWLQRAYEAHEYRLVSIRTGYPLLRSLRDDPKWEALLEQIRISDDVGEKVDVILAESGWQP
jgi:TolB-like protein/DNA-binding winged helix-turn-helix (wHTH) protein/Flp pilus assembly protein TadD